MKSIIITVPLGNGHNSVARALEEEMKSKGVETEVLDLYEYIHPKLKDIISALYNVSMKSLSLVSDIASDVYDMIEKREVDSTHSFFSINNMMASMLSEYIAKNTPDIIVCTQVYAAEVIDIIKEKDRYNGLTAGIITDYTVQSYWENTKNIDYIFSSSIQLKRQLSKRGIHDERAVHMGIPIRPEFTVKISKETACRKLGIDCNKPVILIMGGGMGFVNAENYIDVMNNIEKDIHMIIVCGNNKKRYDKLNRMIDKSRTKLFGYVDNIDLLMDASDVIISKPGGISTAESLAKKLPMIIIDPLPGLEYRNTEFLMNNGAALYASEPSRLVNMLDLVLDFPERRALLVKSMEMLAMPYAAENIVEFLIEKANG